VSLAPYAAASSSTRNDTCTGKSATFCSAHQDGVGLVHYSLVLERNLTVAVHSDLTEPWIKAMKRFYSSRAETSIICHPYSACACNRACVTACQLPVWWLSSSHGVLHDVLAVRAHSYIPLCHSCA
jgi:hypothetical protein